MGAGEHRLRPQGTRAGTTPGGDGGIEFGQEEPPAYSDFAYIAFTVGMSFAAPDTQIVDTSIRKVALGHALLSYLFGTVVIAVAVNLVTNLGQSSMRRSDEEPATPGCGRGAGRRRPPPPLSRRTAVVTSAPDPMPSASGVSAAAMSSSSS